MTDRYTWRDLLQQITNDSEEAQRICQEVQIRSITLQRWINGDFFPNPKNLSDLLTALQPADREQLIVLLDREKEDLLTRDEQVREIPASFYKDVLHALATTPERTRFWSMSHLVLNQALRHLDPQRFGLELLILACMPPRREDGYVASLFEAISVATRPWKTDSTDTYHFVGMKSLPGYAVTSSHQTVIQSCQENLILPMYPSKYAASLIATPLLRDEKCAGCLLVSSTIPRFFSPTRVTLIVDFAELLIPAFEEDAFVSQDLIKLRVLPSFDVQQPILSRFHERVASVLQSAFREETSLTKPQAERIVRHQIETQFLDLVEPFSPTVSEKQEKRHDIT